MWAAALLEQRLRIAREIGDESAVADALEGLGKLVQDLGDDARPLALYQECLVLVRPWENTSCIGHCLVGRAEMAGALRQAERGARQQ